MTRKIALLAALLVGVAAPLTAQEAGQSDQLSADGGPINMSDRQSKAASLRSAEWTTHVIPVCWLNPLPEDEANRAIVRDAVRILWEKAANLQIVGWQQCKVGERAVRILVGDNEWPRAIVGNNALSSERPTMYLNFNLARKAGFNACAGREERCLRFTAGHEFGHMLGLVHEQDRGDTPAECIARLGGQRTQRSDNDIRLLTGYDPNSIMNYCSTLRWDPSKPLDLSPEDAFAIRVLFGNPVTVADERRPDPNRTVSEPDNNNTRRQPRRRRPDLPVFNPN